MLKAIHRMQRDERGFTLVELLIVIAIIAILAAIAIPQFSQYRSKAGKSACESDLKNCVNACAAKLADNAQLGNTNVTCNASPSCNKGGSFNVNCNTDGSVSGSVAGNGAYSGTCNLNNNAIECS